MTIGERLRSRVLDMDQRWIDLALAGTVAVWFTLELLTRDPQGTDRAPTAATGLVVIAALVVRTRHLGLACVLFAAAVLVQDPLGGGLLDYMDSSFAALFALLYTVGRRTDGRTTVLLCVVLYGATSLALSMSEDEGLPAELLWGLGLCVPP